jgi:hypothetical protein
VTSDFDPENATAEQVSAMQEVLAQLLNIESTDQRPVVPVEMRENLADSYTALTNICITVLRNLARERSSANSVVTSRDLITQMSRDLDEMENG